MSQQIARQIACLKEAIANQAPTTIDPATIDALATAIANQLNEIGLDAPTIEALSDAIASKVCECLEAATLTVEGEVSLTPETIAALAAGVATALANVTQNVTIDPASIQAIADALKATLEPLTVTIDPNSAPLTVQTDPLSPLQVEVVNPAKDYEVQQRCDPANNDAPVNIVTSFDNDTGVPTSVAFNLDGTPFAGSIASLVRCPASAQVDVERIEMCDGTSTFIRWFVSSDGVGTGSYDTDLSGAPFTPAGAALLGACTADQVPQAVITPLVGQPICVETAAGEFKSALPVGTFDGTTFAAAGYLDSETMAPMTAVTPTDPCNCPCLECPDATGPELRIVKRLTSTGPYAAGDTLTGVYDVTNTGNEAISNIAVTDSNAVVAGSPIAALAVGATDSSVTWSHVITAAEVAAGQHVNQASATGTGDSGQTATAQSAVAANPGVPAPLVVPLGSPPAGDLTVTKSLATVGGLPVGNAVAVGDTAVWNISVTAPADSAMSNVTLTEALAGATVSGGPLATLAAGATDSSTFTVSKVLTQADIDADPLTNTVTASGTDSAGATRTATDSADLYVCDVPQNIVVGTNNLDTSGAADPSDVQVGEFVTYQNAVTVDGNPVDLRITVTGKDPNVEARLEGVTSSGFYYPIFLQGGSGDGGIGTKFEWIDPATGQPVTVPTGFTFRDIDDTGVNEGVEIPSSQVVSTNNGSNIVTVVGAATETALPVAGPFDYFTNTSDASTPNQTNNWASVFLGSRSEMDIGFKKRQGNTGYDFNPQPSQIPGTLSSEVPC